MLKNIPAILSPELLKVLCEMGHSDRIVIADGNFPAESIGKNAVVIRADGHGVPERIEKRVLSQQRRKIRPIFVQNINWCIRQSNEQ